MTPPRARAPFAGGIAWIVVVAVLLAGVVAVNVVVLQLNMQFDGLSRERAQLKADNALLRSRLSSASANVRIEEAATSRLGLEAADPLTTTYVRLPSK
jgi:cell division protein FtsL